VKQKKGEAKERKKSQVSFAFFDSSRFDRETGKEGGRKEKGGKEKTHLPTGKLNPYLSTELLSTSKGFSNLRRAGRSTCRERKCPLMKAAAAGRPYETREGEKRAGEGGGRRRKKKVRHANEGKKRRGEEGESGNGRGKKNVPSPGR